MSTGLELDLPAWPNVDFAAFGETETVPLSRIQKLGARYLARNWVAIPHVTHHDDVDITELETLRKKLCDESGVKVTLLAFLIKAVASGLRAFPSFNASLDASRQNLVLKKYFHVGFAVDSPKGLVVAVIRDCDQKNVVQLAQEISSLSLAAREKGLPLTDMSGGCMTVSSLGHIGGTGFTPILNAPEVAILGVMKAQWKPVRESGGTGWRLMLPVSLSYDHRVLNGADVARFVVHLGEVLGSPGTLELQ
ncbi:2-oxo acid dehydrogenase subunit E2 [Burkholderia sp. BCC1972]|uniref:2-oxo acid dehydrogenase subunit E2 n=1 Tax=Burkholderia sp. BCC1972 TaxID=2817438 RepID=UPI002ABDCE61|nr:2-oxo acid dehydrogenase subunit E2 [Burkholderia sp. BCC1972]